MSIYIKKDDHSYGPHLEVAAGKRQCFLCGEQLGKTAIHWMGSSDDIYFHPPCAVSFCRRLMQDCEAYFSADIESSKLTVTNWGDFNI